jgi:hypothetical protein
MRENAVIAAIVGLVILTQCSYPLRFDPHRSDLQQKQDQCLAQGKSPKECRP